jgi:hypothetical protein
MRSSSDDGARRRVNTQSGHYYCCYCLCSMRSRRVQGMTVFPSCTCGRTRRGGFALCPALRASAADRCLTYRRYRRAPLRPACWRHESQSGLHVRSTRAFGTCSSARATPSSRARLLRMRSGCHEGHAACIDSLLTNNIRGLLEAHLMGYDFAERQSMMHRRFEHGLVFPDRMRSLLFHLLSLTCTVNVRRGQSRSCRVYEYDNVHTRVCGLSILSSSCTWCACSDLAVRSCVCPDCCI